MTRSFVPGCLLAVGLLAIGGLAQAQTRTQDTFPSSSGFAPGVVVECVSGGVASPCSIGGATATGTPHNPDVATVTTGGTAVAAFAAGHVAYGGWIQNPSTATLNLCVSQTGTAASTAAADTTGGTACLTPGQTYVLAPSASAVSVNATDSAHPYSGQGYY